jgi:hypothetical protein
MVRHADAEHLGGAWTVEPPTASSVRVIAWRSIAAIVEPGTRIAGMPSGALGVLCTASRSRVEHVAGAQHDRALDRVLQLAHVAGPVVLARSAGERAR